MPSLSHRDRNAVPQSAAYEARGQNGNLMNAEMISNGIDHRPAIEPDVREEIPAVAQRTGGLTLDAETEERTDRSAERDVRIAPGDGTVKIFDEGNESVLDREREEAKPPLDEETMNVCEHSFKLRRRQMFHGFQTGDAIKRSFDGIETPDNLHIREVREFPHRLKIELFRRIVGDDAQGGIQSGDLRGELSVPATVIQKGMTGRKSEETDRRGEALTVQPPLERIPAAEGVLGIIQESYAAKRFFCALSGIVIPSRL